MANVNWANIPDPEDYSLIPVAKYPAVIVNAKDDHATDKNTSPQVRWDWEITDGPYQGRKVRDNIAFPQFGAWDELDDNQKKMAQRVKLVCSRLGFDTAAQGVWDFRAAHFNGRKAIITTEHKKGRDNPSTGEAGKIFCNVSFAGVERWDDGVVAALLNGNNGTPVTPNASAPPQASAPAASQPPVQSTPPQASAPAASQPPVQSTPPQAAPGAATMTSAQVRQAPAGVAQSPSLNINEIPF